MIYVDTSAALLILLRQEGGRAAENFLKRARLHGPVASSTLLKVEMARALRREKMSLDIADDFLGYVETADIDYEVIKEACEITSDLKSLDAIHLATALALDSNQDSVTIFTHDARLGEAARARGLEVVDPLG